MKNLTFTLALGAMLCVSGGAYAQQSINKTLAARGHWDALFLVSPPPNQAQICVTTYNASTLFLLQFTQNGDMAISVSNASWLLPVSADTHVTFLIDGHFYNYDAFNSSSSVITANLNEVQLVSLVKNIESAHSMQFQVGSLSPMNVDLDGSKEILQTFIKCSGLQNFSPNKDTVNPFGSSN